MAVGEDRQSHLSSLWLKEHTSTALWGSPHPKGPFCLKGSPWPAGCVVQTDILDGLLRYLVRDGARSSADIDSDLPLLVHHVLP